MPNVMDIAVDLSDALGQQVVCIYGRKAPAYAVYGANKRVMICFADAKDKADEQRKLLSQLAPLRGEIDGLIDGWREGRSRSLLGSGVSTTLMAKANRYNRRVADALIVALEGDIITAAQILEAIKQEILKERTAAARFEYLLAALFVALAAMLIAWLAAQTLPFAGEATGTEAPFVDRSRLVGLFMILIGLVSAVGYAFLRAPPEAKANKEPALFGQLGYRQLQSLFLFALFAIPVTAILFIGSFANDDARTYSAASSDQAVLWLGAGAGAVGAFFSIALGIRTRTVLPDLLRTSNLLDAALRVVIGLLSGAILLALFRLNVVKINLGSATIDGTKTLGTMMIGFLAGFSERLVPDLLDKVNAQPGTPAPAPAVARAVQAAEANAAARKNEETAAGTSGAPADEPDPLPQEAGEDCCASDKELPDDLVSADVDLPPASGGVAKPDEGAVQ